MRTKSCEEIIDLVVKHVIKQGGQSIAFNECVYQNAFGQTCGHSFALTKKGRQEVVNEGFNVNTSADEVINLFGDKVHRPSMRGKEIEFWNCVQDLHDSLYYWDENDEGIRLSEVGKDQVEIYKEEWRGK